MKRLENKVVIVTGSTSGIGIGIARLCAAEGAKVVACGRREDKGNAVVETDDSSALADSLTEAAKGVLYHAQKLELAQKYRPKIGEKN